MPGSTGSRFFRGMFIMAALGAAALFGSTGTASAATPAGSAAGGAFGVMTGVPAGKAVGHPAVVTRVSGTPKAVTNAPLPGFCTLDGQFGATFVVSCSVVVAATAYVFCSDGNFFFWTFPGPGIYQGSGGPCIAIGYALV
jgi:hypothetical protein